MHGLNLISRAGSVAKISKPINMNTLLLQRGVGHPLRLSHRIYMIETGSQKTDLVRIFFLLQKKTLHPFYHLERIIEMGQRKKSFFLNKFSFMKSFF